MTGDDCAKEGGTEDVHHRYRISWLFVFVNLTDPGGEGQNTITGHGKNETGRCNDRNAGALYNVMLITEAVRLWKGIHQDQT